MSGIQGISGVEIRGEFGGGVKGNSVVVGRGKVSWRRALGLVGVV